ncbi:HDOD domain-containing protein [Thiohalobacter sp. IOR34]|uniref:HDOD domain-containing protein n=1 Tax=Thiohalobacter sp. IOR34 TaxID=3057176 RepID=UPI0025B0063F|nr:HDOD domain-containing protein [Thiohalobacter sp. IOR34]WJW74630.1 HDOD domain-containing protein [Thiohalobacter sp. IOR34]
MQTAVTLSEIRPADLPAPPKETIQIVHACSNPDIDSRKLGGIITNDPLLTAELLRIANSPFFGFRSEVRSAAHAVTLLGHRALRNLALCIAMRDALRPEAIPGMDLGRYWDAALRRGVCARLLASAAGLNPDECFTLGLLQDFGLLVLLYLQQNRVAEWERLETANPDERLELERQLFGTTHDQAGQALAGHWQLPADLAQALGHHHSPVLGDLSPEVARLCRLARCADWMAAVFTAADKRTVFARCQKLVQETFDLQPEQVDALLAEVAAASEEAARALGLRIDRPLGLEEVLREANLRLAEDNLSFQELTWRLEKTLAERDELAAELARELDLAREVQCSLLPRPNAACRGIAGVNLSARQLSGDFYDYFPTRGEQVYFAIADVSGKGMNAALLMAKASSLLRCLGKGVTDPVALAAMLNREISETAIRGMFVTAVLGIYNPSTGKGKLVNAGHLPVLQFRPNGEVRNFEAGAPPLGVLAGTRFSAEPFSLADGPLYLFTDGITEARTRQGSELGITGLKRLIRQHQDEPTMERRLHRIVEAVRRDQGTLRDDLTLLMVTAVDDDEG